MLSNWGVFLLSIVLAWEMMKSLLWSPPFWGWAKSKRVLFYIPGIAKQGSQKKFFPGILVKVVGWFQLPSTCLKKQTNRLMAHSRFLSQMCWASSSTQKDRKYLSSISLKWRWSLTQTSCSNRISQFLNQHQWWSNTNKVSFKTKRISMTVSL